MSLLLLGVNYAESAVIFSNFAPNFAYDKFLLAGFGLVPLEPQRAHTGSAFTPSADHRLDSLTLPLQLNLRPDDRIAPQPLDIFVMTSSANGAPGEIIESISQTLTASSPLHLVTVNSTTHPLLRAGLQYWIVVTAGSVAPPDTSG